MENKPWEKKFSKGTLYYLTMWVDNETDVKIDPNEFLTLVFALGHRLCHVANNSSDLENAFSRIKKGPFLIISLQENPYPEWNFEQLIKEGHLTVPMIHTILNILNFAVTEGPNATLLLEVYLNILIILLTRTQGLKSSFTFRELQIVHQTVHKINSGKAITPLSAGELIRNITMPAHRFHRACREMFGSSLHSIIQHQKMKTAFDEITIENKSPALVAGSLGFIHYENFSTRFRIFFGITPLRAATYYPRVSRLF